MLINFDDLTILGQGSEWFWTMLTMIALSVTFVAIYRQLRAQHAAVAFEQVQSLTKERESERMRYDCLRLAIGLRRGDDLEELEPFLGITDFYEKVSFLHRQGYLHTEVLYFTFGEHVVRWWTVTAGTIEKVRLAYEHPGELAGFEGLAAQMRAKMAKRGVPAFETDPESITGRLDWIIAGYRRQLEIEREFRSGEIPVPRPAPETVAERAPEPAGAT